MKKSTQIASAFAVGVVFIVVMLVIAVAIPYPSSFQLLVFRVTLSFAAGGLAAMLPGFLTVSVSTYVRAGGALAGVVMIYFFNPAALTIQGTPTEAAGVFVKKISEDRNQSEYYWKQADLSFRFPKDGWTISTKAAEAGLGDMTLQHESGKDAQIQLHVSVLDGKYREHWKRFRENTTDMWKGTISQFGPFESKEVFVDGRSGFEIEGVIEGEKSGLKDVSLVYAPLGDNRLFEMHLTRNENHQSEFELTRAFDLIVSTVRFDR